MSKVLIPLAKGFEEIEAVSLIDVLRRGGIEVIAAYVGEEKEVVGANNITILGEVNVNTITSNMIDMIVLPGGFGGTEVLSTDEHVQQLIKDMHSQEKLVGAICAAPIALHKAGALNQNYTCYPSCEEHIRDDGYDAMSAVVKDAHILTSRGPGTAICFGISIVEELEGKEMADALRQGLLATFCE
jgi:protein deglycase